MLLNLEAVARKYCELTGIDPDEKTSVLEDIGGRCQDYRTKHRWEVVAEEVKKHYAMNLALKFAEEV